MRDGPDFICVGIPKAGTGWLFDQLDAHSDFWMPPVKEILYLGKDQPRLKFANQTGDQNSRKRQERLLHREIADARDQGFMDHARACNGQPGSLDRYAGLFRFKGNLLSGDISPPYWSIAAPEIADIASRFPALKVILLVRDPVDRAWSRIATLHHGGQIDGAMLNDEQSFRRYIKITPNAGAVLATEVVRRWRENAPEIAFHTILFDDIVNAPDKAVREVLKFLGTDPEKKTAAIPADYNRKAGDRLAMTGTARAVLVKHFTKELRTGAKLFGSHAQSWAAKYGV
jgi:hypothetical protein